MKIGELKKKAADKMRPKIYEEIYENEYNNIVNQIKMELEEQLRDELNQKAAEEINNIKKKLNNEQKIKMEQIKKQIEEKTKNETITLVSVAVLKTLNCMSITKKQDKQVVNPQEIKSHFVRIVIKLSI